MNILFVSFNTPWKGGGTFYRALGFARALVGLGHAVTLLATSAAEKVRFEELRSAGVNLVLAPSILTGKLRTGWDLLEAYRRYRWIQQQPRFDLIHGFESRPTVILPALRAAQTMGVPLVLDWCDLFGTGGAIEERPAAVRAVLRPVETYFETHFRTRACLTTVINSFLRDRAIDLGVDPASIFLLPNGVDIKNIIPVDQTAARRRFNLPAGEPIVGYLGNSYPGDAALMFDSFRHLRSVMPAARLMLIGNHKIPADLYADIAGHVFETGFVSEDDLKWALGCGDVMWLLQRDTVGNRGRFSMKITDYMAAGRPAVSTGIGDVARLFERARPIGELVPEEPATIAEATAGFLTDPARRTELGNNARRLAERRFGWESIAAGLADFYRRTVHE